MSNRMDVQNRDPARPPWESQPGVRRQTSASWTPKEVLIPAKNRLNKRVAPPRRGRRAALLTPGWYLRGGSESGLPARPASVLPSVEWSSARRSRRQQAPKGPFGREKADERIVDRKRPT